MRRLLLSLLSCLCVMATWADEPFRNHRYDGFKVSPINSNSIVFIGNSITNMHDWHSAFNNHNVVNRGVSGGYATEILANLESYIAGKPAQVFLMIGTNDMAPNGLSHSPEQIAGNIRKIVDRIQRESPATAIRLTSIFPSTSTGRTLEKIQAANALIKALAEEKGLVYVDLYDDLQGILNNTHSRDGLHLSMSGYRIWCNKVKELVGSDCVYPADAENQYVNGLAAAYNMRVSCWGGTPIKADDILFIGDEMISSGEWHEMLNCPNVKNYGQAWGYPGASLDNTLSMLPILFDGRTDNVDPKQVFLYAGVADVNGSTELETVQTKYQNVLNKIKELAPATQVYLMSLQPTSNANTNSNRVEPFNTWLKSVADSDEKVEYVDIYTAFEGTNGTGDSKYFQGNYLWGLGYAKVAEALVPYIEGASAMTEAQAEEKINLLNARNAVGLIISDLSDIPLGDGAGQYPTSLQTTIDEAIDGAYDLLNKEGVTVTELQTFAENVAASVGSLKSSINMPKASTEGEEHWYQISSLRDNARLFTAGGVAAGVQGTAEEAKYGSSMWKFVSRGDDTYDIVNREYGCYLSPTANQNTQIQTTEARPSAGWSLSYGNTQSHYIIYSGTVQLNQTGSPQSYQIYNWGHSNSTYNRDDTGCQVKIQEAAEPEERPEDFNALPEALLNASDITLNGTAPYKFEDNVANAVMSAGSVTVAIDYTLTNGANSEQCLFGSSNSGVAASFSCLNVNASTGKMLARFDAGDGRYTMNGVAGTNRTKVIITMSTSGYKLFVNGSNTATINHSSARDLGSYTDANGLYLGGLVTSDNSNLYPMTGTVHSIRIFPGALTDAQIARIEFEEPGTEPDPDPETPEILGFTIDKPNGNLYHANGSANQNWNCVWKSTATPQLQFGCGTVNNMNWNGDNVQLMTGTNGSATYTLTPPNGYFIDEYSFTFVNGGHGTGITLTMDNGNAYTTTTTEQTVSSAKDASNMSFTIAGANGNGIVLKNFTVKVKQGTPAGPTGPEISTVGNEHWYYITSASTNTYCANKVMYYDASQQKLRFNTKNFNASYIWSFWEENGKLTIKNYNGEYFGTAGSGTGGSTAFGVVSEPNYIYTIEPAYGAFIIKDTGTELHAQEAGSLIVRWAASANGASLWKFDEVDVSNAQAAISSIAVEQGKVTTGIGNKDQGILRATINVTGLTGTCRIDSLDVWYTGSDLADVTKAKAYLATNDRELFVDADNQMPWREENAELLTDTALNDKRLSILKINKDFAPGKYYLWIAYDISETATEGNLADARIRKIFTPDSTIAYSSTQANPAHAATIFLSEGTVLISGDMGSTFFRIPSITVTKDGTRLVTLTDDRKNHNADLPSHCYLVAQYSDDFGKTWSEPQTVAGTATTGGNYGHGDASIVTNRDNGDIVGIMTSSPHGNGFFAGTADAPPHWKTIVSHDNGVTWEAPVDHTNDLYGAKCDNPKTKTWKSGFSGSGAALQLRDGTLVSSFVNRQSDNSQHFYFFMSDDGGENWYVKGTSGTSAADEPKTLERNNGDLAISVRASGYNYYNVTSDRGETWKKASQTRFTTGISGNACDGEYMVWCSTVEGNPWDIAFQTLPNSSSRQNVSIALSTDEGETFGTPKTICPRGSAYSATTVLPDGTLGIYYEENSLSQGYTMRFVRCSLDWVSGGTYKFTEDNPFKPIKSTVTGINDVLSGSTDKADNTIYDLQGRRVTTPTKAGIYIQNGKKVFMDK